MKKSDLTSAIPEEFQPFARSVESWIKKNPEKAVLYATAAGAALGFIGVRRLAQGAQALTKMPVVTAVISSAVLNLVSEKEEA